jgi:hypothetical protein
VRYLAGEPLPPISTAAEQAALCSSRPRSVAHGLRLHFDATQQNPQHNTLLRLQAASRLLSIVLHDKETNMMNCCGAVCPTFCNSRVAILEEQHIFHKSNQAAYHLTFSVSSEAATDVLKTSGC